MEWVYSKPRNPHGVKETLQRHSEIVGGFLPARRHVYPRMKWSIPAFPTQPKLVLIYRPQGEGRLLRWVNNLLRTATWQVSQSLAVPTAMIHWATRMLWLCSVGSLSSWATSCNTKHWATESPNTYKLTEILTLLMVVLLTALVDFPVVLPQFPNSLY